MNPRLGQDGAPPALPIGLLWCGALALVLVAVSQTLNSGLLTMPVQTAGMVALSHGFTLGFVGLVFAGTLQQLPAVMFVTKLAWPNLGWFTTPLLLLGTLLVTTGFASGFNPLPLTAGAVLVSLGWLLLLAQILATAAQRWPSDAGSQALILSVVFLTFTVVVGFVLAAARSSPAIAQVAGYPVRMHITLGLFGAFLLGIIGSGQKLLSMFALSKGGEQWRVRLAIQFVSICVIAEALGAFSGWRVGNWPVLFLAAACLLQLLEVHSIWKRRLRLVLEPPIWRYVMAHAFLPLAGLLMLTGQPVAAAALFMVGYVGLVVSGMLVKITSFLTWTAVFAGSGGGVSRGAPLLKDLMRAELEPVTTWGLALGALALVLTILTGARWLALPAAVLLLIGSLAQLAQVTHVIAATLLASRRLKLAAAARGTA